VTPRVDLDRECSTLHRYLAGRRPDEYVCAQYREAHSHLEILQTSAGWFDDFLAKIGFISPVLMHLVQSYSRIMHPDARVRRKAVLLLAIMECSPGALDVVQHAGPTGKLASFARAGAAVAGFAISFLLSLVLLGPIHLGAALLSPRKRPRAAVSGTHP
jgi:hypothetical protein